MSYFGKAFVFDSTPCEMFDLMMYDIGDIDGNMDIPGSYEIEDELIGDKWKPYFYGAKHGGKLEFDIVFGVNERRIDHDKFLDRWELSEITTWLCRKEYRWLYIDQPDMTLVGYRCMISKPQVTRYGTVPWALRAHVVCDSPYAYLEAKEIRCSVDGEKQLAVYNESSLNDWYLPNVTFIRAGGTAFAITNDRDNDRGPSFTDIPGSVSEITIDNEHCVINNDQGTDLYSGFNFQFLRLARGENNITITGNGTVLIRCEFPINVGG